MVTNLVVNARDAMESGGTVSLETRNVRVDVPEPVGDEIMPVGDYVEIAVIDTTSFTPVRSTHGRACSLSCGQSTGGTMAASIMLTPNTISSTSPQPSATRVSMINPATTPHAGVKSNQ